MPKIALTGAHGTGKTTLTNAVVARFAPTRETTPSREVPRILVEHADDSEFFRRGNNSPVRQLLIMLHQIIEDDERRRAADLVVCDRTLVDHIAYTFVQFRDAFDGAERAIIIEAARRWITTYDIVFYVPIEFAVEDDGVREGDITFQAEIDKEIVSLYKEIGLETVRVTGSVEARTRAVLDAVTKL